MRLTGLPQIAAAMLIATASPGSIVAQDYTLPPTFGVVSITTGFLPDPNWIALLAGGENRGSYTDVATGAACNGYFADAPDMRVFYDAGDTYPLAFYVDSREDTVLLVNTPDGAWHCNDDTVALNPAIEFARPLAGQYDIWVGTYAPSNGEYPPATLGITEVSAFESQDFTIAFFGEDDREVVDASAAPWNMIGFVDLSDASCTGVLVGPSTVLTAGHCLANGGVVDSTPETFFAGFNQGNFVASSRVTGSHIPSGWMQGEQDGTDFAFLFLADPIGDQVGWMEIGPLTSEETAALQAGGGPTILQAGYSYDQQGVMTGHLGCPFVGLGRFNEIFHECDTLQGDSGSPLFIEADGGYRIIGVESHTRDNPDASAPFNLNVAMYTADVLEEWNAIGQGAAGGTNPPAESKKN